MIVEWFTTWITTKTFGFLVKTIISEEFLKDLVKDYAKDFFKNILNNAITAPFKQEPLQKAEVMALTEFVQLMQQDLEYNGSQDDIKKYTQPIKHFLKNQEVKQILGSAFKHNCQAIDTSKLQQIWYQLNSSDDFNWKPIGKKYLQKVKEIILEVDQLREILNSQNLEKTAQNTTEIAGIIPQFDLERYQEAIGELYGNLKLDNLDTTGYAYNELKLWRIFIAQNVREANQILPQHELPKEHLRRLRESNQLEAEVQEEELKRYKQLYLEQAIRSVLDIVNEKRTYKYIVILGDPGSGKSTLLQFLALNWAQTPLDNVISLPIPLLIELRTYMRRREDKECHNFLEFFHKCSGAIYHLNQHELHEQLKAGRALVMFDGLDEVFYPGKREDVINDIHRFTNEYPNVQVIVTSRVIGYKAQRLRDAEFRHFILQDLEAEQIQDFIYRWHELTFNDEADKLRKRERLQRGIEASKSIAELAGNPLLLTMMAILNRNQELPRDRAELYNQASRVLLHQWDVERALIEDKRLDPKTIDYKDKQAMLRQVACYMQTSEKGLAGNLISAGDLENILTDSLKDIVSQPREVARVMINQLRTRNFMLCFLGADYYAFVHRTFLEYFCAWEFVWQFEKTRSLTIEELKTEVFGKHWQDETWHEVLQLIVGMIEPKFAGEIIQYLIKLDGEKKKFSILSLAAKCLVEVRNRSVIVSTANELVKQIKDRAIADNDSDVRRAAVEALVSNFKDDPDTLPLLKERAIADYEWYVRRAAVEALVSNFKDDPDTLPLLKERAIADYDGDVQRAAVQALASNFKDDPDTLPWLKERAIADNHGDVRRAAVQALASNFKDDPDTLPLLKERAIADNDGDVQYAAVKALASNFKDDPDTLPWLEERAIADNDYFVRRAAVEALVSNFKDDPDTLPLLKERAIADNDWDVRRAAVKALVSNFKDDPDILGLLKRAIADNNTNVRRVAVEALVSNFKDDPDTLRWLKERAIANNDSDVRYAAVEALASNFKDDPDTLRWLKEQAIADNEWYVRRAAVEALASNFKDDPDTLRWLKERAIANNDSDVRRVAVEALASNFKDDPGMFEVFYNCAVNDPFKRKYNLENNPRKTALKAIIEQYPQHPQTLPLLRDKAANDADEEVREFAQKKLKELEGAK
ncbi:MAG: HEAT repeat domain-containing protein [Tolypothrix carrinoi HA7290-LM1]|jgi:predicted NACHT family NTPase|nr:HEAT repeat domain-containing protein [Tolypothrix carrinoi HA7290-LM1]